MHSCITSVIFSIASYTCIYIKDDLFDFQREGLFPIISTFSLDESVQVICSNTAYFFILHFIPFTHFISFAQALVSLFQIGIEFDSFDKPIGKKFELLCYTISVYV